jgi:hypothetical protein
VHGKTFAEHQVSIDLLTRVRRGHVDSYSVEQKSNDTGIMDPSMPRDPKLYRTIIFLQLFFAARRTEQN